MGQKHWTKRGRKTGVPHALANAKLVQAELRIVKDRVEAYIAAIRESALYAARR